MKITVLYSEWVWLQPYSLRMYTIQVLCVCVCVWVCVCVCVCRLTRWIRLWRSWGSHPATCWMQLLKLGSTLTSCQMVSGQWRRTRTSRRFGRCTIYIYFSKVNFHLQTLCRPDAHKLNVLFPVIVNNQQAALVNQMRLLLVFQTVMGCVRDTEITVICVYTPAEVERN